MQRIFLFTRLKHKVLFKEIKNPIHLNLKIRHAKNRNAINSKFTKGLISSLEKLYFSFRKELYVLRNGAKNIMFSLYMVNIAQVPFR